MTGKQTAAGELRAACRDARYRGLTAGLAPGFVQVNLVILPQRDAENLVVFCRANATPCPVVAIGMAGEPFLPVLGDDIDVRSDCPRSWIFNNGQRSMEVDDIRAYWLHRAAHRQGDLGVYESGFFDIYRLLRR